VNHFTWGMIGGSGLYDFPGLERLEELELDTPFGPPSSPIRTGMAGEHRVAFLARHGRRHRLSPTEINHRANIYALKLMGVTHVISASAVGSLREDLPPRSLCVPDQFVDRTRHRKDTFFGQFDRNSNVYLSARYGF